MAASTLADSQRSEISVGTIKREALCANTFVWNIPDFFYISKAVNQFIESPKFTFMGMIWRLCIYPNGSQQLFYFNEKKYISMYLHQVNPTGEDSFIEFTLGIRKKDGTDYRAFCNQHNFNGTMSCGIDKLIERSTAINEFTELSMQGVVTFFCTLQVGVSSKEETSQCMPTEGFEVLLENLKEFLKGEDADVIFKVKDEDFKAHKTFLKVRSPVFKSMFSHNMKENTSNIIVISDCDPKTFCEFLHFVYCGEVEELSVDTVFSLYFLGDKYDVKELRNICVQFIIHNMSIDNFFEAMTIALRHDERAVLKHATDFFLENSTDIIETAEWLSFLSENHVAANELYLKALKSLKIKCSEKNNFPSMRKK